MNERARRQVSMLYSEKTGVYVVLQKHGWHLEPLSSVPSRQGVIDESNSHWSRHLEPQTIY